MVRYIISLLIITFFLLPTYSVAEDRPSREITSYETSNSDYLDAGIFAAPDNIISPKVSPDGSSVVYQEQTGDETFLTVANMDNRRLRRLETPKITWFTWVGNKRILAKTSYENARSEYNVLDLETLDFLPVGYEGYSPSGTEIIFVDPAGEYFLQSKQGDPNQTPSVFRVDIAGNIVKRIVKPQKNIWNWYADNEGVVRVGMAYFHNSVKVYYRKTNDASFVLANKIETKNPGNTDRQILFAFNDIVSGSDQGYVMSNQETGRFALYKYNYLTGEIGDMVFSHESNDINNYSLNRDGTKLMSVTYTEDRDRVKWFDIDVEKTQSHLEKALPGQEVWLGSQSLDGNSIVIYTISSTDPGSFYFFRKNANSLERIGGSNDDINPDKMSLTKYVSYTARDGLEINGYLTLPKGREAKNLPLIILPHGGPYGVRDNGDYDPQVQFLANRGYAVLQPNFRGSESYGEAFFEQGKGEIGRKMQDDLDDGMDWLVKQDIVDESRVCIVGASYGGYAALWGVIRNPERYRCAASFAGVTEFNAQLKYDKRFFRSRYAREWKTTVRGDEGFNLDSVSPVHQVSKLTRPVLLTHGDKDSNVPFSQYKKMVKAAKKANKPLETHVYKGEGHGFKKRENRIDWYNRLEAFLQKHNPAFVENP